VAGYEPYSLLKTNTAVQPNTSGYGNFSNMNYGYKAPPAPAYTSPGTGYAPIAPASIAPDMYNLNYGAAPSLSTSGTSQKNPWGMDWGNGKPPPSGFTPYMQGAELLGGLSNIYLGFKGLKLAKDQFGFAKDSFNTNLANQAKTVNNEMLDREYANLAQTGNFDVSTPAAREALRVQASANITAQDRKVSGAPV